MIVISCVRNSRDILQRDLLQRLGFLRNPKRFNVALTRAKSLLICIGNAAILSLDNNWREFIEYANQLNAWGGIYGETETVSERLKLLNIH